MAHRHFHTASSSKYPNAMNVVQWTGREGRTVPDISKEAASFPEVMILESDRDPSGVQMPSTSEHSCSSDMSNVPKDMSCQKSSDVKFTISTLKRNVPSISNNNVLRIESNGSDDNAEGAINEFKRQRLTLMKNGQMTEPGGIHKSESSLVIPMVTQKDWRIERLLQMKNEGKLNKEELAKLELLTESASSSTQETSVNKVDGQISESLSSVDADYDSVPIEVFGLAVLRGCGWREGEGIGKTNKKVVPLRISSRRPKGLGLGATILSKSTNSLNSDAGKLCSLKKASLVKIIGGIYRNLYGRIESFDEDNASVIVRLAVGDKIVRVSHYAVILVTDEEYKRKGRSIAEPSHDGGKHSNGKIEMKDSKVRTSQEKNYKKQKSEIIVKPNREGMWARPELKVRFIDRRFKNGKLYNEKVRILDAADRENCIVEDFSGNKYFQISEHWLETVIPKARGTKLMIVNGPLRGNIAVLEAKDKKKHTVIARLITTDEIVTMYFDDVCEYLGSFDDF
ncbi:KOW domain-containing protein family protein [Loa loa]|uniref:KOW domain-containing protein family protein n=2 Tax=Loa loa TaxID=7209 RepID=A0A1S0U5Z3_LOALO|nr:KOW domain-containing protein family protein [Loa loa]EFO25594.2 KOW domain-containing protein family protein [Loa loa]